MSAVPVQADLVSVVMPAYNEEGTLRATVRDLVAALRSSAHRAEIVVVDDGSADRTSAVIAELAQEYPEVRGVLNAPRHGYGYAVRKGIEVSAGHAVVVVMADGSDSPADVVRYLDLIAEGHDCAFGSRFTGASVVKGYPVVKRAVNRLGNFLIGKLVKSDYDDFTNGFKAYRRHVIDKMQPLRSGQFNLTVEMSVKAVLSGATAATMPNDWRQREAGASAFSVARQSVLYFMTLAWLLSGTTRFMAAIEKPARVDSA